MAPPAVKDVSMIEAQWYDEQRLQPVGKKVVRLNNGRTPGFDKAAPKR